MNGKYTLDMTKGPFLKKIVLYSIPLILTGLLQLVYNTADIIVVGRFAGTHSLAAVGATSNIVALIFNLFIGLSTGACAVVAKHIGAKDDEKISRSSHTSIALGVICGVICASIGFFFARPILVLFDTPADILDLSTLYLKIFFLGAPASLVYNFGSSVVRAMGDTKRPLYILLFSGIFNVGLNLFFVISFNMGVAGVATATIISQYISAVLILIIMNKLQNSCRLDYKKIRLSKSELKEILYIGLPAGLQSVLFSLSNNIIQAAINSFGSVVVAGVTAGSNYESYIFTCANAFAITSMTFSSQNYGAKEYKNMGKVLSCCTLLTCIVGLSMCAVGYFFPNMIIGLFSTDPAVIKAGAERLVFIMQSYILCCLMNLMGGQIRGMGRSIEPLIISLLGACGLRILWIYTVFASHRTLITLYWSYPMSWGITFLVYIVYYYILKRKLNKANA